MHTMHALAAFTASSPLLSMDRRPLDPAVLATSPMDVSDTVRQISNADPIKDVVAGTRHLEVLYF